MSNQVGRWFILKRVFPRITRGMEEEGTAEQHVAKWDEGPLENRPKPKGPKFHPKQLKPKKRLPHFLYDADHDDRHFGALGYKREAVKKAQTSFMTAFVQSKFGRISVSAP